MSECRQTLKIKQYEVWVNLGCSAEEQKQAQPVRFTLEIKFLRNLPGCATDNLNDAVNYVALVETIQRVALLKPYHLIEHLNQSVFEQIILECQAKKMAADITLTVHKVRVPIAHLIDGVEFTCQQIVS